jgi:HK97 family phage major capsid protein
MTIAQRIAKVDAAIETRAASREFIEYARALILAKGIRTDALELAQSKRVLAGPRVVDVLKSAVAAATTTDTTWASGLAVYSQISAGFISSLQTFSCFDRIWADNAFVKVPMRTRIATTTLATTGSTVGEGSSKIISRLTLAAPTLAARKSSCIVAISDELVKVASAAAVDLLGNELRKGLAIAVDGDFLTSIISNPNVDVVASSGATAEAVIADLSAALVLLATGANSKVYIVTPPKVAKAWSLLRGASGAPVFPDLGISGGSISGVNVVCSDALSDSVLVIDAAQIAADASVVVLDASAQASLELDEAPTDAAQALTSLWQHNMQALKAERWWALELLNNAGAAVVSGVSVDVGTAT